MRMQGRPYAGAEARPLCSRHAESDHRLRRPQRVPHPREVR